MNDMTARFRAIRDDLDRSDRIQASLCGAGVGSCAQLFELLLRKQSVGCNGVNQRTVLMLQPAVDGLLQLKVAQQTLFPR